jgi:hypothetical protein
MARLDGGGWPGFEKRDGEGWDEHYERQGEALRQIERDHTVMRFPVADGYALYAVIAEKPLVLRHIPYGDAYRAAGATIRGTTLADVERQRAGDAATLRMRDENAEFYASLRDGQVVHYDNGFGQYVRCEAVVDGDGKRALKEVALVGAWREYDLPRRDVDGTVRLGYHAEGVAEGRTITPHISCIWESGMGRRSGEDPAGMAPLDLSVPDPTPDEEEVARLWRKVAEVRGLVSQQHGGIDPAEVLRAVREAVAA